MWAPFSGEKYFPEGWGSTLTWPWRLLAVRLLTSRCLLGPKVRGVGWEAERNPEAQGSGRECCRGGVTALTNSSQIPGLNTKQSCSVTAQFTVQMGGGVRGISALRPRSGTFRPGFCHLAKSPPSLHSVVGVGGWGEREGRRGRERHTDRQAGRQTCHYRPELNYTILRPCKGGWEVQLALLPGGKGKGFGGYSGSLSQGVSCHLFIACVMPVSLLQSYLCANQ